MYGTASETVINGNIECGFWYRATCELYLMLHLAQSQATARRCLYVYKRPSKRPARIHTPDTAPLLSTQRGEKGFPAAKV